MEGEAIPLRLVVHGTLQDGSDMQLLVAPEGLPLLDEERKTLSDLAFEAWRHRDARAGPYFVFVRCSGQTWSLSKIHRLARTARSWQVVVFSLLLDASDLQTISWEAHRLMEGAFPAPQLFEPGQKAPVRLQALGSDAPAVDPLGVAAVDRVLTSVFVHPPKPFALAVEPTDTSAERALFLLWSRLGDLRFGRSFSTFAGGSLMRGVDVVVGQDATQLAGRTAVTLTVGAGGGLLSVVDEALARLNGVSFPPRAPMLESFEADANAVAAMVGSWSHRLTTLPPSWAFEVIRLFFNAGEGLRAAVEGVFRHVEGVGRADPEAAVPILEAILFGPAGAEEAMDCIAGRVAAAAVNSGALSGLAAPAWKAMREHLTTPAVVDVLSRRPAAAVNWPGVLQIAPAQAGCEPLLRLVVFRTWGSAAAEEALDRLATLGPSPLADLLALRPPELDAAALARAILRRRLLSPAPDTVARLAHRRLAVALGRIFAPLPREPTHVAA